MKQSNAQITVKGEVVAGLGTGKLFVTKEEYKKQFKKKIGYIPYAGTLNLKIKNEDRSDIGKYASGILIRGFRENNRTYGQVKCLDCTLKKDQKQTKGTIVIPQKTRHRNILEIISPQNLRKTLNLKNNDIVEIILNV
jgi:riboflavin kinase